MQDGCFCLEMENLECHTLDGPESQGSSRIVNSLVGYPGEGGKGKMGRNVRRKEASVFKCLIVKAILVEDIFDRVDDTI